MEFENLLHRNFRGHRELPESRGKEVKDRLVLVRHESALKEKEGLKPQTKKGENYYERE